MPRTQRPLASPVCLPAQAAISTATASAWSMERA